MRLRVIFIPMYVDCPNKGAQIFNRYFPPTSGDWKCRIFASLFSSKSEREGFVPGLSSWLTGSWFLPLSPSVCVCPQAPSSPKDGHHLGLTLTVKTS